MHEVFIRRFAEGLHRVRPTWSRAVPDLLGDRNGACEHKLAVPGYAQLDGYSCGATAGWAVVKTFHPQASFSSFYRTCNPSLDGITDAQVIRALRRHGVGVSVRTDLTYARVRETIRAGFPIITGIGREVCDTGDHFVVIYGVGWNPARVFICNQPRWGCSRQELTWADFRATWAPLGHGLICWGKPMPSPSGERLPQVAK